MDALQEPAGGQLSGAVVGVGCGEDAVSGGRLGEAVDRLLFVLGMATAASTMSCPSATFCAGAVIHCRETPGGPVESINPSRAVAGIARIGFLQLLSWSQLLYVISGLLQLLLVFSLLGIVDWLPRTRPEPAAEAVKAGPMSLPDGGGRRQA